MKGLKRVVIIGIYLLNAGCFGPNLTKPSLKDTRPYPLLHSVPDRPEEPDFTKANEQIEQFKKDYQ